ncbi:MAG: PAS domain S-box protein [Thermotogota bacterium]
MENKKDTNQNLKDLEWMLNVPEGEKKDPEDQFYGDLTLLNTDRTLLDTVGKETLKKIAKDSIDLLDSSVAVYEKNGDYAMGIFTSGWCRKMDATSRKLCGDCSNKQALESGKWICHDSCWDCSKRALESGEIVDESCDGGINLYAIPIIAEGQTIGVLSVGYGNPPEDEKSLRELSEKYNISLEELRKNAHDYQKRPKYIEEIAKKRMRTSAELIALIYQNKKDEEALEEASKQLERFFSLNLDLLCIADTEGYFVKVNKAWETTLGYPVEQLENRKFLDFVHPDDVESTLGAMSQLKEQKNVLKFINRYHTKDGTYRYLEWYAKPYGKLIYSAAHDITQKIYDDEALRESEEKYRLMFKNSPVGIFNFDKNGVLLDVNDSFVRIIGSSREVLIGLNMLNLPDKMFVHAVKRALNGQQGYYNDEYHAVTSGKSLHVRGVFSSIEDNEGNFVVGIGIIEDISEQKKTEQALIKAKEEAQAANRAKSDFLASMSHEIRTPINGVIGFSELLEATPLNATQREYNDIVQHSAKSLLTIINDILDFSKIEAGKLELQPEKTNLYEIIDSALNLLNYKAAEKGIELIQSGSKNVPKSVYVDPIRLRQILLNLLSNAVKFTEEGEVELKVRKNDEDTQKKVVRLLFAVTDTGIGIPEENIQKILEPFNQGNNTVTQKFVGTGLGLAITKSLLAKMGSQLTIESTVGVGSTFSFELALKYPKPDTKEGISVDKKTVSVERHPSETSNKKVLIVEDNKINMQYIETVLKAEYKNLTIINAHDGESAIELFVQEHPDLILLDIQLPKMNGYEVTGRIKQIDKHVPIIAITAKAFKGEKEKCLKVGMTDYFPKPITISTIKTIIKKYL